MGTQLNEESYQKLIDESIVAVEKYFPEYFLKKMHIIDILKWSAKEIYHKK